MKKLFRVDVYYYVMASSPQMALAERPMWGNCTREANLAETVSSDWYDCIPFGSEDDSTCSEILADQREGE